MAGVIHIIASIWLILLSLAACSATDKLRRLQGTKTGAPTLFPVQQPTQTPTSCGPNGLKCGITQTQYTTIRIQQLLTARAWPDPPAPNTQRLTAAFVYANKPVFKGLVKATDFAQWVNYAGRVSSSSVSDPAASWLQYAALKAYIAVGWGTQAGSMTKTDSLSAESLKEQVGLTTDALHEHVEMEIESVRELSQDESAEIMKTGRMLGGGGCLSAEDIAAGRKLGGGGGGSKACPPPPPSPFAPQILITYFYTFTPLSLGFSSRASARNSFNNAVNNWRSFTIAQDSKWSYQATFQKKLTDPTLDYPVFNSPVAQVQELNTASLVVSDAAFANGVPTPEPSGLPPSMTSGLKNSAGMDFTGYIFIVLFLLLALGIIYFFCHKKSKIMEAKLDETFFTGKANDEELLKAQAAQQEATLAKFEMQMQHSMAPPGPPGASPHMSMARKSVSGDMYPPPHFANDPRMSVRAPSPARRMSQAPPGHHQI